MGTSESSVKDTLTASSEADQATTSPPTSTDAIQSSEGKMLSPTPGAIFIPTTPPSATSDYQDARERNDSPHSSISEVTKIEAASEVTATSAAMIATSAEPSPSMMPSALILPSTPVMPSASLDGVKQRKAHPKGKLYKSGYFKGFYDQHFGLSTYQWNDLQSRGRCYWKREWVILPDGKGEGEWQERAVRFADLDDDQKVSWFNTVYHQNMLKRAAKKGVDSGAGYVYGEDSMIYDAVSKGQGSVDQVAWDGNGDLLVEGDEDGGAYDYHIERIPSPAVPYGPMPLHIEPHAIDGGLTHSVPHRAKDDQRLAHRLFTPSVEAHRHLRAGTDRRPLSQKLHESMTASQHKIAKDRLYRKSRQFPGQTVELVSFKPNGGHDYGGLNTHISAKWKEALPPIYREGWGEFTSVAAKAKRMDRPVGDRVMSVQLVELKFPTLYKDGSLPTFKDGTF